MYCSSSVERLNLSFPSFRDRGNKIFNEVHTTKYTSDIACRCARTENTTASVSIDFILGKYKFFLYQDMSVLSKISSNYYFNKSRFIPKANMSFCISVLITRFFKFGRPFLPIALLVIIGKDYLVCVNKFQLAVIEC